MSWTPVNINPFSVRVDDIVHIKGLDQALCRFKKAWVNINLCVNGLKYKLVPDGYDIYVLGIWFEVFDDAWFAQCVEQRHNAMFIILTDMLDPGWNHPRIKFVRLLHWKWFFQGRDPIKINWHQRQYKISSLSNKITQYRFFVTAALMHKKDVIFTWNAQQIGDRDLEFIYRPQGRPYRDRLLALQDKLTTAVNGEVFTNDPELSLQNHVHPAYSQSLVNSINETKDVSWCDRFGMTPSPYLTEKTWKPLLCGNALLFTGQRLIKQSLEHVGFVFDYPWSNDYADIDGDLDRLEGILETIDNILMLEQSYIKNHIKHSVEHNHNLVWSGKVSKYIDCVNQKGLEVLAELSHV